MQRTIRRDVEHPRSRLRYTRLIAGLFVTIVAGFAAAAPEVRLGTPEADAVLNRPLPADPLELLGPAQRLATAGLYDDAAAVTRLAERGALLAVAGREPPTGATVREAIRAGEAAQPSIDELRAAALASVQFRIPPTLADETARQLATEDASALPATGGEWTTHLLVEGAALRVPLEVNYAGRVGAIGGLTGHVMLVPQRDGRTIVMTVNERSLADRRFLHGEHFWIAPRVVAPQPLSEAAMREALRGLAAGRYRVKVELDLAWLTPSEDPRAPMFIISRGRGAVVDDRFQSIPEPSPDRPKVAVVPARCAAFAPEPGPPPTRSDPPRPRLDDHRAPVPLTSPLLRTALARGMASDPGILLDMSALLSVTRHPDEAAKLAALTERAELLALLGERVDPRGTIGQALAAPAPSAAELATLRECVMRTAIGVDLVNLDSTHGVDFFGRPYVHEAPRASTYENSVGDALAVPLEIANQSAARLIQFEFIMRLAPVAGGEPITLRVGRTGGSALRDHERTRVPAVLQATDRRLDAAALDAVVAAARRGDYRAQVSDWTLVYGGELRFRLSARALDWLDPDDRELKARQIVAAASCADTASCATARSGRGLSSATTWVLIELFAAIALPLALARRFTPRRGLAWTYAAYTLAAIGAALLLRADPPSGIGMSGILSVGAAFFLGLPWTLSLPRSRLLLETLRTVFLDADAGVVEVWIGIAVNHVVLGALAFRPRRAIPSPASVAGSDP
jgi:hypothetical protein